MTEASGEVWVLAALQVYQVSLQKLTVLLLAVFVVELDPEAWQVYQVCQLRLTVLLLLEVSVGVLGSEAL